MWLPDVLPLQPAEVEPGTRVGMSEKCRETLLRVTTLLRSRDGTLAEAVMFWRRKIFAALPPTR